MATRFVCTFGLQRARFDLGHPVAEHLLDGIGARAGQRLGCLVLAVTPHLPVDDSPSIGIHRAEITREIASERRRELTLHLIAETVDLVRPVQSLICRRRMLDEQ